MTTPPAPPQPPITSTTRGVLEDLLLKFRLPMIIVAHAAVFAFSLWAAFMLRLDFTITEVYVALLPIVIPIFVVIKLGVFLLFQQFSGWWRYVSLDDLLTQVRASVVSMFVAAATVFIAGFHAFPRSVFVLDLFVTVLTLSAMRVTIRLYRERFSPSLFVSQGDNVRTLVVGTGHTAESLVREVSRDATFGIAIVGIVTTDPRLTGTRMGRAKIVGVLSEIPQLAKDLEVEEVIIALERGEGEVVRELLTICRSADIKSRVLPPASDILQGKVSISSLRDVDLQDLLGRPPIKLDMQEIGRIISGNVVLVTGAGGSIGSELCRQVAGFGPGKLILLEQAENPLFFLERELRTRFPKIQTVPLIADVYDADRLQTMFATLHPDFVLHAAAHKHVPLMEANPTEALKNNVIGTLNVLEASAAAEVGVCVVISTDKAVNPTSVMGASKRMAEMLCQSMAAESETRFAAVRFGNVLGSNGSVIPIFQEQIRKGGPVTVTHPKMERFFMTIPEASRLVLQAATFANAGEIFVLDMGKPVKIVDVARDLIRLSGLVPDEDIEIVFTGVRPGEKLYEELALGEEETERTAHGQIFKSVNEPQIKATIVNAARNLEKIAHENGDAAATRKALFDVLAVLERRGRSSSVDFAIEEIRPMLRLVDGESEVKATRAT